MDESTLVLFVAGFGIAALVIGWYWFWLRRAWKPRGRFAICVDFDGVIHSFTSKWERPHLIPDPPTDGALEWLWDMIQTYDVYIMSARGVRLAGRNAIRAWLYKHAYPAGLWYEQPFGVIGLEDVKVVTKKPHALIYIDDRAWRFGGPGTFPTRAQIEDARPWNRPVRKEDTRKKDTNL